ncbi:hypothetical protein [Krasilnikovia sp. MM14-A1259]|uniref:hypothetical protein n=1 Tax=Krasilnikovia sp. MM14-A1259 TaxID=3373539 RepID=UPI00399D480D
MATLAAAPAAQASTTHVVSAAQASGCEVVITSVKALELQETVNDETYLKVGDESTKAVKFVEGQTHSGSAFTPAAAIREYIPFGGNVRIQVWEYDKKDDPDELIGTTYAYCTPGSYHAELKGNGADYLVKFDVTRA